METGRYLDASPTLFRSDGAMEGAYPGPQPIPFNGEMYDDDLFHGAMLELNVLMLRCPSIFGIGMESGLCTGAGGTKTSCGMCGGGGLPCICTICCICCIHCICISIIWLIVWDIWICACSPAESTLGCIMPWCCRLPIVCDLDIPSCDGALGAS